MFRHLTACIFVKNARKTSKLHNLKTHLEILFFVKLLLKSKLYGGFFVVFEENLWRPNYTLRNHFFKENKMLKIYQDMEIQP